MQSLRTRNFLFVAAFTKLTFNGAHSHGYFTPRSWSEFDANCTSGRGFATDAARRSAVRDYPETVARMSESFWDVG
jgi:hypothetical protein